MDSSEVFTGRIPSPGRTWDKQMVSQGFLLLVLGIIIAFTNLITTHDHYHCFSTFSPLPQGLGTPLLLPNAKTALLPSNLYAMRSNWRQVFRFYLYAML